MLQPMPSAVAQSTSQPQPVTRDASALRAAPVDATSQPGRPDAAASAAASETIIAVEQAGTVASTAGPLFNARLALSPVPADLFGPKPSFKITLLENLREELRSPPPEQVLDPGQDSAPEFRAEGPAADSHEDAPAPAPAMRGDSDSGSTASTGQPTGAAASEGGDSIAAAPGFDRLY